MVESIVHIFLIFSAFFPLFNYYLLTALLTIVGLRVVVISEMYSVYFWFFISFLRAFANAMNFSCSSYLLGTIIYL